MDASETTASFSPAGREAIPQDTAWQERLLPVMAGSLAILTLFFCASLTYETIQVQRHIESAHEIDLNPLIAKLDSSSALNSPAAVSEFRAKVLSMLEANVIERRYHQASAAAMGRIYLIFLGFATGMVLSLAGATFILGKLKEAPTEVGGAGPSFKATLRSGSPGLVLAAFGTVLMLSTIFSRADITVTDQALYLGSGRESAEVVTGRDKEKEAVQKPSDILRQQVEPVLKGERTKNGGTK